MTSLSFSSNGKFLLVGTAGDVHYVVDAFDGITLFRLIGHLGLEKGKTGRETSMNAVRGISGEEMSWTPDSRFILGGSVDGRILAWEIDENKKARLGEETVSLSPTRVIEGHPSASRCVKFNPRFAMMASAGTELVSTSAASSTMSYLTHPHFRRSGFPTMARPWILTRKSTRGRVYKHD